MNFYVLKWTYMLRNVGKIKKKHIRNRKGYIGAPKRGPLLMLVETYVCGIMRTFPCWLNAALDIARNCASFKRISWTTKCNFEKLNRETRTLLTGPETAAILRRSSRVSSRLRLAEVRAGISPIFRQIVRTFLGANFRRAPGQVFSGICGGRGRF